MTFIRGNAQTLSRLIRVDASPAKVWELITTIARITEWYDTWDAVEQPTDEERLQVGTSSRLIRHRIGRDDVALCRVTSLQPRWRLCWVQYAPHLPAMSVEFQLLPETDETAGILLSHTRSWIVS